jgi:hypothetical protein
MTDNKKTWNYAVVGTDANDSPKYLGFTDTYDDAATLKQNLATVGWQRLAIFDAALQEVKEEPKGKAVAD